MMSEQIDNFTNSLRNQLNDIEDRLSSIKTTIESASQETQTTIESQLKQVKTKLETKRYDFDTYQLEVKRQAEEKQAEVESKIDGYKTNQEIEELNRRADQAEEYAARGIAVAMAAIDEAEGAILEAIVARLCADNAVMIGSIE
jgi:chromosome segregation ATPase